MILTAIAMTVLIGLTALGVDLGSVYVARRQLQGITDAAALGAALQSADPTRAANAAITANGSATATISGLNTGAYTPDRTRQASARFVADGTPSNAVKVTLRQDVPLFFGRFITGRPAMTIQATATAVRTDFASFSLGSRLAAAQGGLPGALLSGLAGAELNLSIADYNALVGGDVDLLAFSKALRTQLGLNAASLGDTLNATATLPQVITALAAATTNAAAATTLRSIAGKVPATTVQLSKLIDLGPLSNDREASGLNLFSFSAYAGVREILQLANGQRSVSLAAGIGIPGILSSQLTMVTGQRAANSPWLTVAKDNAVVVRTAQTRFYLETQLAGTATLGLVALRLPMLIDIAPARASLDSITCPGGAASANVALNVTPGVASVQIGTITPAKMQGFGTAMIGDRATILQTLLINVTGRSNIQVAGVSSQRVTFMAEEIRAGQIKTVSANDALQGVASSLIRNIDLQVGVLGLGVNVSIVTAAVGGVLATAAPALDGLIDTLTGLLGVRIGQADVGINGVRCGRPMLVA